MTNHQKLKVLVVVLFCLIIVLAGMLFYAKNIYVGEDKEASGFTSQATAAATASSQASASGSSQDSSPATSEGVDETIDLKLYVYDAEDYDKPKEVQNVSIDKKLYTEDLSAAINQLLSSTGLKINKAVVSGNRIMVDLPRETALDFNKGSAGGITNTNILAMTMVNLPSIEKLQITVDGVEGVVADHFNFNGIFSKSEDGSKYLFAESDKEGKELVY